ncbi:FGGY carbohydrate kinase domain-containing protein [Vitis vinifera]|uniref:FGGY carbohydrate kinase domain-containing protein n=1 Tax=Vitis vinifera TaxID=29760 RepID=A0A438D2Y1_VITVI|nr:FGGY carbohydrate kinase domain-containing protein [Vitis vinifera]
MGLLNKALLGKWIWRFTVEKDVLWKKVIGVKHGLEGCGWKSKDARGPFGVGVWKEILKEMSWCWNNMKFKVGRGTKIRFWTDHWCGNVALSQAFPQIFALAVCNNELVNDVWDSRLGQGGWNLRLVRDSNDWELVLIEDLLFLLREVRVTPEEDSVLWKGGDSASFRIRVAYNLLAAPNPLVFPGKNIWVDKVPTKVAFFAWEATWEKILTLDRLQMRGWQLPNCCFLCGCEEENVNHILLHCTVVKTFWEIAFALFGVQWVFPEKVKEALFCWRGPFGRGVLFTYRLLGVDSGPLRLIDTLLACGGLAKNPLFLQEHADIVGKYGQEEGALCTKEVRERYEVGVWKAIKSSWEAFKDKTGFKDSGSWGPRFIRQLHDWELEEVDVFFGRLHDHSIVWNWGIDDIMVWLDRKNDNFLVKSFYSSLASRRAKLFPYGCPIVLPRESESVLLGAAILGAVASKKYSSLSDSMKALNAAGQVIHPAEDPKVKKYHDAKYQIFRELYEQQLSHRSIMAQALA